MRDVPIVREPVRWRVWVLVCCVILSVRSTVGQAAEPIKVGLVLCHSLIAGLAYTKAFVLLDEITTATLIFRFPWISW